MQNIFTQTYGRNIWDALNNFMIRCKGNKSKEVRLCKSLHILSNRQCRSSECELLKNEQKKGSII